MLVTRTASPNAILAAHEAFAALHVATERRLFVLADRVSEHAMYHGKATLLAGLRAQCTPALGALATSQGCLLHNLQFIQVAQEPSEVDLADVPVSDSPLAGVDITVDIRIDWGGGEVRGWVRGRVVHVHVHAHADAQARARACAC